jgi:hypothetical protein
MSSLPNQRLELARLTAQGDASPLVSDPCSFDLVHLPGDGDLPIADRQELTPVDAIALGLAANNRVLAAIFGPSGEWRDKR